jgi:pimeloyl-ACP methyl ester carboxylesterase
MPHLEVITRHPSNPVHSTPLLFVHGAFSAAWVWDENFLPFFAEHGYQAHALSLRGHGRSVGHDRKVPTRLRDYVADLAQVAGSLPRPPLVIGHSMGGMVVQHYLQRHSVPGAVLMASVPPHGLLGSMLGMMTAYPNLYREMANVQVHGPMGSSIRVVRRALISDTTPPFVLERYLTRFDPEPVSVMFDLLGGDLPPSLPRVSVPVLVLGAVNDPFVFRDAVEGTARSYRTRAEFFPLMGHAMMLDGRWEQVARRILLWLRAVLPDSGTEGGGSSS